MALDSYSQFWLLDPVTDSNFYLPFDEGSGELIAEVEIGEYTLTNIAVVIQDAMNAVAVTNTYSVSFDRSTRKYTITSDNTTFSLLISTGSVVGVDIFSLIGFSGSDTSFNLSQTSNNSSGSVYSPQFKLQDYVPSNNYQEATSAAISTTASGDVEVVSFGTTNFIEMSIMFCTNIAQPSIGPIRNNLTGEDDFRNFMIFATKKYPIEFIIDEDDYNTFENILLEKTESDSKGVGFKIKEMYGKGLPGYFESGKLTFRNID